MMGKELPAGGGGVLAAPIGVEEGVVLDQARVHGLPEGRCDQRGVE